MESRLREERSILMCSRLTCTQTPAADRHSHANMSTECEHGPLSSSSRKQKVIAPSIGEAEFYSLASGISQELSIVVMEFFIHRRNVSF